MCPSNSPRIPRAVLPPRGDGSGVAFVLTLILVPGLWGGPDNAGTSPREDPGAFEKGSKLEHCLET